MKVKSSFCPICARYHDPDLNCTNLTGQVLRDAGLEPKPIKEKEFQKTVKEANRSMLTFGIVVLGLIALTVLLVEFISNLK